MKFTKIKKNTDIFIYIFDIPSSHEHIMVSLPPEKESCKNIKNTSVIQKKLYHSFGPRFNFTFFI